VLVLMTYFVRLQIHTNPQILVQRLPLRLARISPPTQQRLFLTLPTRKAALDGIPVAEAMSSSCEVLRC
jgi:hypothetical protein